MLKVLFRAVVVWLLIVFAESVHGIVRVLLSEPDTELAHIEKIMREGTGANRQLSVWERTQDMKAIIDQIVAETCEGLNVPLHLGAAV